MKVTAIIVAAGLGKRMGQAVPKQFLGILGKPLLAHTLTPFEAVQAVNEVTLLIPAGWEDYCRTEIVEKYGFKKVSKLISGGKERQDSVYRGLQETAADTKLILIHDGVRPLVTKALIEASITVATSHGAAAVAIPLGDTLKKVGPDGLIRQTLNRDGLWLAQTPQTFQRKTLLKAYETALREHFYSTDDAALVERAGFEVKVVPGTATNLKVTTPEDLRVAELLLSMR
jgi:2-C-methyl-D-erythritol 4-phosphate cytidylyltransferase